LWGRGTIKILEICETFGLPCPYYSYEGHDFWVTFRKNIYNQEYLQQLGLNQRQINAIIFVKSKSKISNKDYQKLVNVSKATATRDLTELTDKFKILIRVGKVGSGTNYKLIGL